MARSKYELVYPHDGTRRQIDPAERNSLLLSRSIQQVGPTRYKFIGQVKTFHSFADLGGLIQFMSLPPCLLRHYLDALRIIFELAMERELQLEQTPEAMVLRLDTPSGPCCKFNPEYAMQENERRKSVLRLRRERQIQQHRT